MDRKLYWAYRGALQRCTDRNHHSFPDYGGRGIQFRFRDFQHFAAVLGPPPSRDHSVDRKDPQGHYEPGNVRWATREEQANNRGDNYEVRLTLSELARATHIPYHTLHKRIRILGIDPFDAVMQPVGALRRVAG